MLICESGYDLCRVNSYRNALTGYLREKLSQIVPNTVLKQFSLIHAAFEQSAFQQ